MIVLNTSVSPEYSEFLLGSVLLFRKSTFHSAEKFLDALRKVLVGIDRYMFPYAIGKEYTKRNRPLHKSNPLSMTHHWRYKQRLLYQTSVIQLPSLPRSESAP